MKHWVSPEATKSLLAKTLYHERAGYINKFMPAVIIEYSQLQEAQQLIPLNLALDFAHADGYKAYCVEAKGSCSRKICLRPASSRSDRRG
jgi:hypothetical protein